MVETLSSPRTLAAIRGRLAGIAPTSERRWGSLSVGQMVSHLNDSFDVALGARKVPTAESLLGRTLIKWIALWAPMRWPKNIPVRPEVDQRFGGTPPSSLDQDRIALLQRIQRFAAASDASEWGPHPIFGKLTVSEWKRWGFLHVDHHLRQFGG